MSIGGYQRIEINLGGLNANNYSEWNEKTPVVVGRKVYGSARKSQHLLLLLFVARVTCEG